MQIGMYVFIDENPDSAYDTFCILTKLINKMFTIEKIKRNITDKIEWLTKGILIYCVQKNNLLKKTKKDTNARKLVNLQNFEN